MTYVVKPGDTLSAIAKRYGINWRDLYNTNKGVIGSNYNLIRPNQKLTIPGTETPAPTPAPTPVPVQPAGMAEGTQAGQAAYLTPFEEILSKESYINPELIRGSAEQIAASYYAPIAQRQREELEGAFANRGLTRSGLRGQGVSDLYTDLGKKQKQMALEDFLTDKGYAEQEYAGMQELYENTEGKQKPQQTAYTPYKVESPTTAAGKYGTTYLNWLNQAIR